MSDKLYRLALLLIMLGAGGILTMTVDPIGGIGLILLVAGTTLLREIKTLEKGSTP